MKRLIVKWLEKACVLAHPIVHHRPWLWLPLGSYTVCPLAGLSDRLDQRWNTGVWTSTPEEA